MAKVKLDLRRKTDTELLQFATAHQTQITGNPAYPTPSPDAATFDPVVADFEAKLSTHTTAQTAAKEATAAKDDSRETLEAALNDRGNYVESESGGDEATILSAGFDVREPAVAIGDLPAPIDFLATMGDMEGEIDLAWDPVKGANVYMVECKEHNDAASWELVKPVTDSKMTVTGLTSGNEYAFRVAAVGAAGQGPWSDESVKRVP